MKSSNKTAAALASAVLTPPSTTRTCVYLHGRIGTIDVRLNLNNHHCLEPYSDYYISEYLQDVEEYDGRKLVSLEDGGIYCFSDGTSEELHEIQEEMPIDGVLAVAEMISLASHSGS